MIDRISLEKQLLVKLLSNHKDYFNYSTLLSDKLFNDSLHRKIYNRAVKIINEGDAPDLIGISSGFNSEELSYVVNLYNSEIYSVNFEKCLLALKECEMKETTLKLCDEITQRIESGSDIFETLDKMETKLSSIKTIDTNETPALHNNISSAMEDLEKKRANKGKMLGISSGYIQLDKLTGGWQSSDLVIVGGASSMGKTALSLSFAKNAAQISKDPTVVFSYEMGTSQLVNRLLSSESDVNNRYISMGVVNDDEFERVYNAANSISDIPLYIDECKSSSITYLINKIKKYSIVEKAKLFVIDYLQLITNPQKGRNREQEVSYIARALKNVAKEMNVCVMALSQLNRSVSNQNQGRPTLSHLRESGEIEQAADIVMFVYRPEYYGIERDAMGNDTRGIAELIIAKGRNIGTGIIPLSFEAEYAKFSNKQTLL